MIFPNFLSNSKKWKESSTSSRNWNGLKTTSDKKVPIMEKTNEKSLIESLVNVMHKTKWKNDYWLTLITVIKKLN